MSETVVVDPEQVADVLEAAADLLNERGWKQGIESEGDPRVCILRAVGCVTDEDRDFAGCHRAIRALQRELSLPYVSAWNDEPGREAWEVDELLRITAKRVRHGDITVGR